MLAKIKTTKTPKPIVIFWTENLAKNEVTFPANVATIKKEKNTAPGK